MNTRVGGLGARSAVVAALCLLMAVAGLTAPTTAHADATLTLDGRGFGHGHGMSQWGAKGRADAGQSWTQILGAYYPGTTLTSINENTVIRVRVMSDTDNITQVVAEPGLSLRSDGGTAALPTRVSNGEPTQWRIRVASNRLVAEALVSGSWRAHGDAAVDRVLDGRSHAEFVASDATVRLVLPSVHREYHGSVRAVREPGSSTALRTVVLTTLRNYLPPVVTAEMPSSWHMHALRAQAVAARSYALSDRAAKASNAWFDTCDTTQCQVFNGRADYNPNGSLIRSYAVSRTVTAVNDTAGRYLAHGGSPAFTQFSASNGGYSVAGSRSYLAANPDPFDALGPWTVELTAAQLQRAYPSIGRFSAVSTSRDGRGDFGGRVTQIRITGSSGSVTVTGNEFRSAFGLRSTLFSTRVSNPPPPSLGRQIAGDERPDVAAVSSAGQLATWRTTGPLQLRTRYMSTTGWSTDTARLTLGHDLSGSGRTELISIDGRQLVARPADGVGGFSAPRVLDTRNWSTYTRLVAVHGFVGNGPGLVAVGRSGTLYYFAASGGRLGARQVISSTDWNARPQVFAVGDWNGDGRSDLASTDAQGRLWLHPSHGNGRLGRGVQLASGWQFMTGVVGGADWDGDGRLDLLALGRSGTLWSYRSDGNGRLAGRTSVGSDWGPYRLIG